MNNSHRLYRSPSIGVHATGLQRNIKIVKEMLIEMQIIENSRPIRTGEAPRWLFEYYFDITQVSMPVHLNTALDNFPVIDVKTPKWSKFSSVIFLNKTQYFSSNLFIHVPVF